MCSVWGTFHTYLVSVFYTFCTDVELWILTPLTDIHYQVLVSAHAGIGAVLIGLAFFIAQEITKKNQESFYKNFIIVKRSRFFNILLAEVLSFLIFVFGGANYFSISIVFVIAFWTMYSLYKTFDYLIDESDLSNEEMKILTSRIKTSFIKTLNHETRKIIGNKKLNEIFKEYEDEKLISFNPFIVYDKKNYIPINLKKTGTIVDVKINDLKKLVLYLQQFDPQVSSVDFNSETTERNNSMEIISVTKPFLRDINETNNSVIWIRKDIYNKVNNKRVLEKISNNIFVIKNNPVDLEYSRTDIKKLKLFCLNKISEQKTDELSKLLDNYVELILDFYKYMKPYGGGFSSDQSKDMNTDIFFGQSFDSISWIIDDFNEIFEKAMISGNKKIARDVGYIPIRLMQEAIDYKDHLIFDNFSYYPIRLYYYSNKNEEKYNDISNLIKDRSWRNVRDLANFYLEPKLKEEDYPVDEFEQFAIKILKIFQNLLRESFKNKDIDMFQEYLSATKQLFRHVEIREKIYRDEKIKSMSTKLKEKKEEMLFGLSMWIFNKYSKKKADTNLREFYNKIQSVFPNDLKMFTNIFLRCHNMDTEKIWGWDDWEMSEKIEGEVHTIQVMDKLEKFYAVKSLMIIANKNDNEIESMELPYNRDLSYLAEGTRGLIKFIEDISSNKDVWKSIIGKGVEKTESFKKVLKKVIENQEQDDSIKKKNTEISSKKVEDFKNRVIKSFEKNVVMRPIFKNIFNSFVDNRDNNFSNKKRLGLNVVDDKASFFEDWHVGYIDWGDGYGRSMASGEDHELLDNLAKNSKIISESEFENALSKINQPNDIVIIATNVGLWRFFENSKNKKFLPEYHRDVQNHEYRKMRGFGGVYLYKDVQIPIFQVFHKYDSKYILILNKNKTGKLTQFSPINNDAEPDDIQDIFYISVKSFSKNEGLIDEFLNNPPVWLKEIGSKQEQKEHLLERVRIQIFEKIQFKRTNNFEGYKIIINKK